MDDPHLKVTSMKSKSGAHQLSTSPQPTSTMAVSHLAKNGDGMPTGSGPHVSVTTPVLCNSSHPPNILLPPTHQSESGSPQMSGISSLRDVIAHSISKTMQQPIHLDKRDSIVTSPHLGGPSIMDQYKWPMISVKKGLGTDVARFGSISASGSSMLANSASLNAQLNQSTGTGGKGTRPKRGKYRNYDRDSLVEAVKAVQRGEMSVHRAGSYYGVPHSTLEYKVKERHLMRPRKREPKPQPLDDRNTNSGGSAISPSSAEISGRGPAEKSKLIPSAVQSPLKNPPFDIINQSNGMKGPAFLDSGSMGQPPYSQHMFWPPHPPNFPGMSIEFSRAAAAAAAAVGTSSNVSSSFPNSESFFATQMRQRFQEHAANSEAGNSGTSNSSGSGGSVNSSANNSKSTTPNSALASINKAQGGLKTARQFAESLYDGGNANGLLDGIIRHSLDRKSSELHHGILLDQLKNNFQFNTSTDLSEAHRKRTADSPLDFGAVLGIKRERASPDCEMKAEPDLESEVYGKDKISDNILKLRTVIASHDNSVVDSNGGGKKNSGGAIPSNCDIRNTGDDKDLKTRHAIGSSSEHEDNEESS